MNKLSVGLLSFLLLCSSLAGQSKYGNFKVSVYTRAYEVEKMKDLEWLDSTWNIIASQVKVDKIYLETHRDLLIVPESTIIQAKKYFEDRGIEVGGGITYTVNESNNFETFCYSNPEHRIKVREIAEHTAKFFDDFILDDFFFTNCKCDLCIKAKGKMSWTEYRTKLLAEAGESLVIKPAKKINPNVKVIIKYPNWYDHFQGLGFDLEHGPQLFDGMWTGTETRDPSGNQHLQAYLGYNIVRYFDNLRPGYNLGGWVDSGGSNMGMDRYAEQLWITLFAKAPEVTLFAYNQLIGVRLRDTHKTAWQGMGTSFDWEEMMEPIVVDGKTVQATTLARAAGITFEKVDKFMGELGNPVGIQSYKPYNSIGEDFLPNYLGMIALPMDMRPEFPVGQRVVLLTEQAKYDKELLKKIQAQLQGGGDVVITTGLLKAVPDIIAQIAELRCTDLKALVNDFGRYGVSDKDIIIPQVQYLTNDAWELASAGRPLTGGVSGYPMLTRAAYSKGNLYVLTIPDNMGDMYDLPEGILNAWRQVLCKGMGVRIEGPSNISLYLYDNGTFIVESFLDEPVTINVLTDQSTVKLRDLVDGSVINVNKPLDPPVSVMFRGAVAPTNTYKVTIMPHSYRAFRME